MVQRCPGAPKRSSLENKMKNRSKGRVKKLSLWNDRTIMAYRQGKGRYQCYYKITNSTLARFERLVNWGKHRVRTGLKIDKSVTELNPVLFMSIERREQSDPG